MDITITSTSSFTIINKIMSKLNRFEVYANKKMFAHIFHGTGAQLYECFHNKHNRKVIAFFFSLVLDDRAKLTDYLKTF